jgi:hypothetical protein
MAKRRYLREIRVKLEPLPPGHLAVPLPYPGLRTKLGGEPDWIQGDYTPECPDCGKEMVLIAQIDSVDNDSPENPLAMDSLNHEDFMFGDVGMIYVFYCYDCLQPGCVHQCY